MFDRGDLAQPTQTGLRSSKKGAKCDRAGARDLRERLTIERLPESWIPPKHILDLRSRVGLRHTLPEQRGEWQQRIQATLHHQGCPQRRQLMTGDGREWLAAEPLPAAALEQVTIALAMIDAVDRQMPPLEKELRAHPRRQAGRKALMVDYGIGDCARSRSSPSSAIAPDSRSPAKRSAMPGWT